MNKPLSDEEERAKEKLLRLRIGALYASSRAAGLRVAAGVLNARLGDGKIDGVIWIVSSSQAVVLSETLSDVLKEKTGCIRLTTFQTLSHNVNEFFRLLGLIRDKRLMLVIDDGLYIKNVNAVRTHRIWMLAGGCTYRLLIASAPFETNLADVFPQWYALDARVLGYKSYWGFCANHIKHGKLINGDYLSRAIAPYCACVFPGKEKLAKKAEYVWQFRLSDEAYEEYRRVVKRFEKKALYSNAGIYRMLCACHMAVSGRRIVRDYPLETVSLYESIWEDRRIQALLEVLNACENGRILIVCRYRFEILAVSEALKNTYGEDAVQASGGISRNMHARYFVESLYMEKRLLMRQEFQTVIHFSQSWSLRKRRNVEEMFGNNAMTTVINIVAADTIDVQMVKRVWKKEQGIKEILRFFTERKDDKGNAQDIQG